MIYQLVITPPSTALRGSVPLPDDQDVALARVALAALSRGRSNLAMGSPQRSLSVLMALLSQLGVDCLWESERRQLVIKGVGLFGFRGPDRALDVRGEAHVAALAMGLLVSQPFATELWVDEIVADVLCPALATGHDFELSRIEGQAGVRVLICENASGERKDGVSVATSGAVPWVKQALLLAALRGRTKTIVEEKLASPDHLERAMLRARVPLFAEATVVELHPVRDDDALAPQSYEAVGSARLLAPLASVAYSRRDCEIQMRDVCLNPTRTDFLSVLRTMGAWVQVTPSGDRQGEPFGTVTVGSPFRSGDFDGEITRWTPDKQALRAVHVEGETAVRLGDSAFDLMTVAARADGVSTFADLVPQMRSGDHRIFGRVAGLFRSAGLKAVWEGGMLSVEGRGDKPLSPLMVTTGGDGRLAMMGSVLALSASGPSTLDDVECLQQDFPRWLGTLRAIGASLEMRTV